MGNKDSILASDIRLRIAIVSGLFAILFIIYLAGDIWVWRGAMLGELAAWVAEEGGESAFWGAAMIYSLIILLAFAVAVFDSRWFRWLVFILVLLLTLLSLGKMFDGFAEYPEVGWYFFMLLGVQAVINLVLVCLSFHWARLNR